MTIAEADKVITVFETAYTGIKVNGTYEPKGEFADRIIRDLERIGIPESIFGDDSELANDAREWRILKLKLQSLEAGT